MFAYQGYNTSTMIYAALCSFVLSWSVIIKYCIQRVIAKVKYRLYLKLTKDTPYLALVGKLWGVYCEYFIENQLYHYRALLSCTYIMKILCKHCSMPTIDEAGSMVCHTLAYPVLFHLCGHGKYTVCIRKWLFFHLYRTTYRNHAKTII